MKAGTVAAKDAIKNNYDVKATPRLIAEWEHNRFSPFANPEAPVTVVPAITPDVEWHDIYDLHSIAEPNRPRAGIAKARFDDNGKLKAAGRYRDIPQSSRFYLSTPTDVYRYWSSQQKSGIVASSGAYSFATPIELTLMYDEPVLANKIVVGFETSYSQPVSYSIQITTNGTTWTTVTGVPPVAADGKVTVWSNATGAWGDTPQYFDPFLSTRRTILGIRLTVYSMKHAAAHLDVLQMGARLEADLSAVLESYGRDFEISERSLIAPLGGISSNTASINLSNMDGLFNNENEDSPFFGLIGKKIKMTMDLSYDLRPTGSADERIREFTMWVDSWKGQDQLTASVSVKDSSVFLQEASVPKVFWGAGPGEDPALFKTEYTVGAIIWQLMDILGFTNYAYSRDDLDEGQIVPYFWPEDGDTAWEQISELAEGTQTAVYFDEYDVMQIKTRNAIFSDKETIDWNFDAIAAGGKLPDIVELNANDDLVSNSVSITYKPTKFSDFNNGLPKLETIWEPEEDSLVLRASALTRDLLVSDAHMWISYNDVVAWPYSSVVNIRGEVLSYKGKEYVWRQPGGGLGYEIVYNQEDKARVDAKSDPNLSWQNSWSGKLVIDQRGLGGTEPSNHYVKPSGYEAFFTSTGSNVHRIRPGADYMTHKDGHMRIAVPGYMTPQDVLLLQHPTSIPGVTSSYGVRMRFPSEQVLSNKLALGGLQFSGDGHSGYFLEISPTEYVEGENRAWRNEVSLLMKPNVGGAVPINVDNGVGDGKGVVTAIHYDKWFDVDVVDHVMANGYGKIVVYIDGVHVGTFTTTPAQRATWISTGRFGVFIRNRNNVDYEYLYGISHETARFLPQSPDRTSFLDLRRGGFTSGYIEREWKYANHSAINHQISKPHRYNINYQFPPLAVWALDEYGPIVHEVREFEVVFEDDSVPAAHSVLMYSNTAQIACTDYYADPFGARFTLVNASRQFAILKGEDKVTFGADNSIDQSMFIYGRVLKQEDDMTITREDKPSIRRNGVTTLEFDNRFIQTEEAAEALADWVVSLWGGGVDEIEMEVFGNPFIQLGDLVTVNYPLKDMYPATHKYFVVSLKNSFNDGLETDLVLRRARV